MKTIRIGCFETNSSSCHSLVLDNKSKPKYFKVYTLDLYLGWFGCQMKQIISDPQRRLVYITTAAAYIYTAKEMKEMAKVIKKYFEDRILDEYGYMMDVNILLDAYKIHKKGDKKLLGKFSLCEDNYNVQIDHESTPDKNKDCMRLAKSFANPKKVYEFVMNKNHKVVLDANM